MKRTMSGGTVAYRTLISINRRYCNLCFRNIAKNAETTLTVPDLGRDVDDLIRYLSNVRQDLLARREEALYEQASSLLCRLEKEQPKKDDCGRPVSSDELRRTLWKFAFQLPNRVHPDVKNGTELLKEKDLLKMSGLNRYCGERSYYLVYELAKVEQALLDFTVRQLLQKDFELICVPDILPDRVIQSCGMPTADTRTQVFKLDPLIYGDGWCLSGTSEMAIAAFFANKKLAADSLPLLLTAISRCYRAEISFLAAEKGLYRVHQFTKVEMFAVCLPQQSDRIQHLFRVIQEELFAAYDLHYRVIDMAAHELGRQAYRKFDIEAWMPGSKKYGEISSCSNCLDYQARRLNIRSDDGEYLHTVNGTACAVPRMLNAIAETHQMEAGRIRIPDVLRPFCGFEILGAKRGPNSQTLKSLPKNLSRLKIF